MGRKPAFTDQDLLNAVSSLQENDKTINGTNLRLEIGRGSPKALYDRFNKLVSTGKIQLKADCEVQELEIKLAAALEQVSELESRLELHELGSKIYTSLLVGFCDEVTNLNQYHYEPTGVFTLINKELKRLIKRDNINTTEAIDLGLMQALKYITNAEVMDLSSEIDIKSGAYSDPNEAKLIGRKRAILSQLSRATTEQLFLSEKDGYKWQNLVSECQTLEAELSSVQEELKSIEESNKTQHSDFNDIEF